MKTQLLPLHNLVPHWGALLDMTREMVRSMRELSRSPGGEGGVINEKGCRSLYSEVAAGMETIFGDRAPDRHLLPDLVVRNRLKGLPREVAMMYLLVTPCAILLLLFLFSPDRGGTGEGSAFWITGFFILFLLALPLLFYRRRRAELLERFQYRRHGNAGPRILIDCAPSPRVFKNLAAACARHLFFEFHEAAGYPPWVREGWIRMVQWSLVQEFYRSQGDTDALISILEEITEELKCAVVLVSGLIKIRPPAEFRGNRSRYSTTSIGSFVTGKPLANMNDLLERSLGTAWFFLARRSFPEHDILNNPGLLLKTFSL